MTEVTGCHETQEVAKSWLNHIEMLRKHFQNIFKYQSIIQIIFHHQSTIQIQIRYQVPKTFNDNAIGSVINAMVCFLVGMKALHNAN